MGGCKITKKYSNHRQFSQGISTNSPPFFQVNSRLRFIRAVPIGLLGSYSF